MTQAEFEAICADPTKVIEGNANWVEDEDHSLCLEFRRDIHTESNYPLFIQGSYNRIVRKLRYSVIHRGEGRIYGLCMGSDHHNPACQMVGGDRHLHRWNDVTKDKEATIADHIVADIDDPRAVWEQFCNEFVLRHNGLMDRPIVVLLPFLGYGG